MCVAFTKYFNLQLVTTTQRNDARYEHEKLNNRQRGHEFLSIRDMYVYIATLINASSPSSFLDVLRAFERFLYTLISRFVHRDHIYAPSTAIGACTNYHEVYSTYKNTRYARAHVLIAP